MSAAIEMPTPINFSDKLLPGLEDSKEKHLY